MTKSSLRRRRMLKGRAFKYIISHKGEQYSMYALAKAVGCEAHTAKKYYVEITKTLADTKENIAAKTLESLDTQIGITIWQKLKRAIVAHILSQKQTQN